MKWIMHFLRSSIGRKIIMGLTGLFLCLFLVIHLLGNLQLLFDDGGEAFNTYAYTMTHNPLIFIISIGTYFFILLHAFQGIMIAIYNRRAKDQKYAVQSGDNASWASRNMAILGVLVFAFLCLHMGDFWWKMKRGRLSLANSDSYDFQVADLYTRVSEAFNQWWLVAIYLIGVIALAIHLNHGFQSAFQTLGLNHNKYTPMIKGLGKVYSFLIPFGFAAIPVMMYFGLTWSDIFPW